tara:strand:+ start:2605 stop:2997 length:393 start_codon:yes stop_codon:yes gene_type:complete
MEKTSGAIIKKGEKFLLLKRSNTKVFNDYWSLPGGHVEKNEYSKEAVKREIKEETNLDFEPIFLKKYFENFSNFNWKAEVKIFYGKFKGNVKIDKESSDFRWFSLKEIKEMKLAFNHNKIIGDFVKLKCL